MHINPLTTEHALNGFYGVDSDDESVIFGSPGTRTSLSYLLARTSTRRRYTTKHIITYEPLMAAPQKQQDQERDRRSVRRL